MPSEKPWETERAELLEKIRHLEERLEQVAQLTAVGELASTTTHEFNNILTTVLNRIRTLARIISFCPYSQLAVRTKKMLSVRYI